nr:ATP phosphoribosyltransferase regulatory subunit [Psychrobacter sp. PraFG1]UTT87670.1 ATP phosphoribosyltransferase regulatory subunit [Psychrobacter sp. PraFG1]
MAIFARLKELAGLSENDASVLMNLYANKALPELKQVCAELPMGNDFYQLAVYGHDMNALKQALSQTATQDKAIIKAVQEVQAMVAHIKNTYQSNVSVDITELDTIITLGLFLMPTLKTSHRRWYVVVVLMVKALMLRVRRLQLLPKNCPHVVPRALA